MLKRENIIQMKLRNVYGKVLIYPSSHCQKAKAFAHLINKKTFSVSDLVDIAFLGFYIVFPGIPESEIEPHNLNGFIEFQKFLDDYNS